MNYSNEFFTTNPTLLKYLYDIDPQELMAINSRLKDFNENQITQFCVVYRSKRRDPTLILILALIGLFGVAGIQRFIIGNIGMGILYFLTFGLCGIGTIIDAVNYKNLAFEYNSKMIMETLMILNLSK